MSLDTEGTQIIDTGILEKVTAVPFWFHSMDLGGGVMTPGVKSREQLANELAALDLPDLTGKAVLDIGAWDGFFSYSAERLGAERMLALDHYVWSIDLAEQVRYHEDCMLRGELPKQYESLPNIWRPDELPGKQGFDTAHELLNSRVESRVADFMTVDLETIGVFDVVFYLGVLYHITDPLEALRRLARVTGERAVIETQAFAVPATEGLPLFEFYGSNELVGDHTNWWAPNLKGFESMCLAAGFDRVEIKVGPPHVPDLPADERVLYRLIAHAFK